MTQIALDSINILVIGDSSLQNWFDENLDQNVLIKDLNLSFCQTMKQARRQLKSNFFDLMILNYDLPDGTGFLTYETLKYDGFNLPNTLLISSEESEQLASEWFRRGGDAYRSQTNLDIDSLRRTINEILSPSKKEKEHRKDIYRDSVTDLWNPRYLIRLLDRQRNDFVGDYPIGCSMVEIQKKNIAENKIPFRSGDTFLCNTAEAIRSGIAHTGTVGRYWGSMFWTFFQNRLVGQINEKIKQTLEAVDNVFGQEDDEGFNSFAGAIITERSTIDFQQLQQKIDKTLFKAKQNRGTRLMVGRL